MPTDLLPCSRCHRDLPDAEFYAAHRNGSRRGRHSWCKTCVTSEIRRKRSERTAEQRAVDARRNRGYSRRKRLRSYGLTQTEFDALLDQQGGVCAICCQPERIGRPHQIEGVEQLAIDHDHATGKVRGLLCMLCNTAIGKFGDDPVMLRQAADYLERGQS